MSEKLILAMSILVLSTSLSFYLGHKLINSTGKSTVGGEIGGGRSPEGKGTLVVCAIMLVSVLTALYTFQEKDWTADLLKVALGVLAGGSAAAAVSISQNIQGNNNFQAVNAAIDKLQADLADLRGSKITQILDAISEQRGGGGIRVSYTDRLRVTVSDLHLPPLEAERHKAGMASTIRHSENGLSEYVDYLLRVPGATDKVQQKRADLERKGWTVNRISAEDNIDEGVLFSYECERRIGAEKGSNW